MPRSIKLSPGNFADFITCFHIETIPKRRSVYLVSLNKEKSDRRAEDFSSPFSGDRASTGSRRTYLGDLKFFNITSRTAWRDEWRWWSVWRRYSRLAKTQSCPVELSSSLRHISIAPEDQSYVDHNIEHLPLKSLNVTADEFRPF